MSYQAKDSAVLANQLKIQEVVVRAKDKNLYVVDSGDVVVILNEAIDEGVMCLFHDNSAATLATVAQADLIVSDSTAYTAGGDAKAIRINGVAALDANDKLVLKFIVQE